MSNSININHNVVQDTSDEKSKIKMPHDKIFAIDFDGTIYNGWYGNIISPNIQIIKACKRIKKAGNTLILNTCRHTEEELKEALDYCKQYGLEFDYINNNDVRLIEKYGECRKICADYYLDDHNISFNDFIEMSEGE